MKMMQRLLITATIAAAVGCRSKAADNARPMYQAPATATVKYRLHVDNRMSDAFRFHGLVLLLDGGSLLSRELDGPIREHLRARKVLDVTVHVTPGPHELRTVTTFFGEGSDESGTIAGYKFELRSAQTFNAVPGGELSVIAYEKDVSSTLEERPAVRYEVKGAPSAAGDAGAD